MYILGTHNGMNSLTFYRSIPWERFIITARNEVGARLCFYMCLWFCPQLVAAAETRTVGKQAVRMLLECFLVPSSFKDKMVSSDNL